MPDSKKDARGLTRGRDSREVGYLTRDDVRPIIKVGAPLCRQLNCGGGRISSPTAVGFPSARE